MVSIIKHTSGDGLTQHTNQVFHQHTSSFLLDLAKQCFDVSRLKNENITTEPHPVVQPQELNPYHKNSRCAARVRKQAEQLKNYLMK